MTIEQTKTDLLESAWHQIALGILMVESSIIQLLLWYIQLTFYFYFFECTRFLNSGSILISTLLQVTALTDLHTCISSARRQTTTPTAAWVASRGINHLRKNPNTGPKDLKKKLQEDHKCEIHYDTVWTNQSSL